MPIYTYRCEACNLTLTKLAKISERDEQVCDTCAEQLKRQQDAPGYKLNGYGYYETDFKSKG